MQPAVGTLRPWNRPRHDRIDLRDEHRLSAARAINLSKSKTPSSPEGIVERAAVPSHHVLVVLSRQIARPSVRSLSFRRTYPFRCVPESRLTERAPQLGSRLDPSNVAAKPLRVPRRDNRASLLLSQRPETYGSETGDNRQRQRNAGGPLWVNVAIPVKNSPSPRFRGDWGCFPP